MEILGIGVVVVVAIFAGGLLLLFVAIGVVKSIIRRTARKAMGEMTGMAGATLTEIGQRELTRGFETFKKNLDHERLVTDPAKMALAVTKLAQKERGELRPSHVVTELGVTSEQARRALERLRDDGICHTADRAGSTFWIFPAFQERREVKVCDYCDSVFEQAEVGSSCAGCGAPLRAATTT